MTLLKLTPLSALLLFACGPKSDETTAGALTTTSPLTTGESTTSPATDTTPTSDTTADPTTGTNTTTSGETTTTGDDPITTGAPADDQTPPQGREAVEAWLAEGHYKSWHCQDMVQDPIPISPHGPNRICSNDLVSNHPADGGEYPVGSAGVKELYDVSGDNLVGYAVYLHTTAGTTGDTWYWYERVPLDSPAPHDENGVVADGLGSSGQAQTICVGCHSATGIDADHPGHDFVYTQVP